MRVQLPAVGTKPFPLVIPVPVAVEDVELVIEVLVTEVELKVKPLTVQKKEGFVTMVTKLFCVAVTTLFTGANLAKSPVSLLTHGSPTIVMSPVIGTANALRTTKTGHVRTTARRHFNIFITLICLRDGSITAICVPNGFSLVPFGLPHEAQAIL